MTNYMDYTVPGLVCCTVVTLILCGTIYALRTQWYRTITDSIPQHHTVSDTRTILVSGQTPLVQPGAVDSPHIPDLKLIDPSSDTQLDVVAGYLRHGPPSKFEHGVPPKLRWVKKRTENISKGIPCRLVINFENPYDHSAPKSSNHTEEVLRHKHLFLLGWQTPEEFEKCEASVESALEDKIKIACEQVGSSYGLYCKARQFRILKVSPELDQNTWTDRRKCERQDKGEIEVYASSIKKVGQWGEQLQTQVALHLGRDRSSTFLVEIVYSFTTLETHDIDACVEAGNAERCRESVYRHFCNRKIGPPRSDDWFLPAAFLDRYLTRRLIAHLVYMDGNLQNLLQQHKQDANKLIDYIHLWLIRSLAATISADQDLRYLYEFWRKELKDVDVLSSDVLIDGNAKSDVFRRSMRNVMPYSFNDSGMPLLLSDGRSPTKDIPENAVLPIMHQYNLDKGGQGRVDCVTFHPDYHSFSTNTDGELALKVITRDRALLDFADREKEVLEAVSRDPHNHLTPMLASWSHSNACFILMPKAERDLEDFLKNVKAPANFEPTFTKWFFTQICGLADGLQLLHILLGARHHDLRLKNILVFGGDILKISDFGTAKLGAVTRSGRSRPTTRHFSDITYQSPDLDKDGSISRPEDVWALGCILLEMMVWAFGFSIVEFREARRQPQAGALGDYHDVNSNFANFWSKRSMTHGRQVFELKTSVRNMIEQLKTKSRGMIEFEELLKTVEGMLRMQAKPANGSSSEVRYDMRKVVESLRLISNQARLNLRFRPPLSSTGSHDGDRLTVPPSSRRRNSCPSLTTQQSVGLLSMQPSAPDHKRDLPMSGSQFATETKSMRTTYPPVALQNHLISPTIGSAFDFDNNSSSPIEFTDSAARDAG